MAGIGSADSTWRRDLTIQLYLYVVPVGALKGSSTFNIVMGEGKAKKSWSKQRIPGSHLLVFVPKIGVLSSWRNYVRLNHQLVLLYSSHFSDLSRWSSGNTPSELD